MNLVKIGLGTILAGLLSVQLASAEMAGPKISGFIDTTYSQDLTSPFRKTNFGRSFDTTANTFLLNTVHLNMDGSSGAAGYHVELDFGADAGVASPGNIQEAYMTWTHMDGKCVMTAGKFVTLEGIEVIESGWNPTISRGYLFGLAEPFSHTGVKMDHKLGNMLQLSLGAVNGWDLIADNNRDKTYFARVGLNWGDPLTVGLVHYVGDEETVATSSGKRNSTDITGVTKWGSLAINFQYNMGDEEGAVTAGKTAEWSGFGIQPVYTISDTFSVGARYESFEDTNGARGLGGATAAKDAYNITVTPALKLSDAVTLRAEYRIDKWTVTATGASKDSSNIGAEMIYTF